MSKRTFAWIVNGVVLTVYSPLFRQFDCPDGTFKANDDIPIGERLDAQHIGELTDITGLNPMPRETWITMDGGKTFAPPARVNHTAQRQRVQNQMTQAQLLGQSNLAHHPASTVDPDSKKSVLREKAWSEYRSKLAAVDLDNPQWPATPVIE